MKYLLIVLALGLVLSPILALQPSGRQRQLQRLRDRAMQRGLQVQFPDPGAPTNLVRSISYRLPMARERSLDEVLSAPVVLERTDRDGEGTTAWRARSPAGPVTAWLPNWAEQLETLPRDVFQVTLASRRLSVEWYERGNNKDVDRIADVLEMLREMLCDARQRPVIEPPDLHRDP